MSYRGRKVLVTGADGFIGSHLAETLVRAGAEVTALAQYNAMGMNGWLDDVDETTFNNMAILRGDVRDAAFIHRLVAGNDVVFHLAALIAIPYSYEAPQSYVDVNVHGTLNVLEACRAHNVGRLVHTSTSEVYGTALTTPISESHPLQSQSPYSASKIAADMMVDAFVRSFELSAMILRPFNTYGPRQSERAIIPTIIRQALDPACETIKVGDVTPQRDFNYVSDTVDAFLRLGTHEGLDCGSPYNTGTGVATSIAETIEAVVRLTGVNKPLETEDKRMRPKASEVMLLLADSERLRTSTQWEPKVSLESGLGHVIEWWRERLTTGTVRRDTGYLI